MENDKPETDRRTELATNYVAAARASLAQARSLVERGSDHDLLYAALELRRAFEALVYDNALRFVDDLSVADLTAWQPKPLLERILEIDPAADMTLEMHVQNPATGEWLSLGTDRRISIRALKTHYYALGHHLHVATIGQLNRDRGPKREKLQTLCAECVEVIERALSATLRLNRFELEGRANFECAGCGKLISRRMNALRTSKNCAPQTRDVVRVTCHHCPASYWIRAGEADGDLLIREDAWSHACPMHGCDGRHDKWAREAVAGMESECPACGVVSVLREALIFAPLAALNARSEEDAPTRSSLPS